MSRGKFITVEGGEGVGKSTNLGYLAELIETRGRTVRVTREPGGTVLAERIRDLLLAHDDESLPPTAELLLFFAARSLNIENLVRPALAAGEWVLCDRFTDATRAYQGYARGLDRERIETLAQWVHGDLEPDLTILLDAPATVGMRRAGARGAADRMEAEEASFHARVRDGYLALAKAEPGRFAVVDASEPLAEVKRQVAAALTRILS